VAESPKAKRRRRRFVAELDMDKTIEAAKQAVVQARKAMGDARRLAKNEKRRRSRLIRKAAALTEADLDRMLVLKRCGLWVEQPGAENQPTTAGSGSAAPPAPATPPGQQQPVAATLPPSPAHSQSE
jgi:hypothetical protein